MKKYIELKIKNILLLPKCYSCSKTFNKMFYSKYIHILFLISILFSQTVEQKIKIPIYEVNGNQYIAASEYAAAHQAYTHIDKQKKKLEIKSDRTKNITLSQNSSFIIVNQKMYHMYIPVIYQNNDFFIPIKSFLNTMNTISGPIGFIDTASENFIMYTQKDINISNIKVSNKSNGMIIKIDTKESFNNNIISGAMSQGWFNLTIPGGVIDSTKIVNAKKISPIKRIRCFQNNESAQISFLIDENIDEFQIQSYKDYININLRMHTEESTVKIKEIKNKWLIDTIIIDAGHGGKDPGAVGIGGIKEKDITLDVAKKLGALLEQNLDVTVIYTRTTDTFVPLYKRAEIANKSNGKLFISIHANSAKDAHRASGFETYLLRPGKWDDAIEVVQRENAVIQFEADKHHYKDFTDEQKILASMAQNEFIKESEFLASQIQLQLDKVLNIKNRGVKQAGFYVLGQASDMPNVLIELGFISNKKDVKLLKKARSRQKMAEAIFRAVSTFKDKYENETYNAN